MEGYYELELKRGLIIKRQKQLESRGFIIIFFANGPITKRN
jgi:hypothetical protein